jgi:hypothetical protein
MTCFVGRLPCQLFLAMLLCMTAGCASQTTDQPRATVGQNQPSAGGRSGGDGIDAGTADVDAAVATGDGGSEHIENATDDASASNPGCPGGMIVWWKGDGDVKDSKGAHPMAWCGYTGLRNDPSCLTTTPTYVPGKVGQAFSFDGTRYVRSLAFQLSGGPFTVDLWAKWSVANQLEWSSALAAAEGPLEGGNPDSLERTFQIDADGSGGVRIQAGDDGIHVPFGAASTSDFQHLAFVYDNGKVTAYLNGAMIASDNWPAVRFESLKFGMNRTYDRPMRGAVDEVHIWNRVLTDAEIADIYAADSSGICQ